jgi:hypothetical protein
MALVISGGVSVSGGVKLTSPDRPPFPAVIPFNAAKLTASRVNALLGGRIDWNGSANDYLEVSTTVQFSGGSLAATGAYVGGTINFVGVGLPYHSYYNASATTKPTPSNFNKTWTYRGGTNTPGSHAALGTANIGFWINGVSIKNPSAQTTTPSGRTTYAGWTYIAAYQACLNAGYTFNADRAGGDTFSTSAYTYRDGTPFLSGGAWEKGIGHLSGIYGNGGLAEVDCIPYLGGALNHPDGHSKILGIAADGYPIYGPVGYADPNVMTSGTKRMVSGYGFTDFALFNGVRAFSGAPPVDAQNPLGTYIQDWTYRSGSDLDIYNGRYCKTPDYPNGTYAYFTTVDANWKPVYPFVIGPTYYGTPANIG